MYTAGVLDVMLQKGIKVDCVVGVSAGALFGVNFCPVRKAGLSATINALTPIKTT